MQALATSPHARQVNILSILGHVGSRKEGLCVRLIGLGTAQKIPQAAHPAMHIRLIFAWNL